MVTAVASTVTLPVSWEGTGLAVSCGVGVASSVGAAVGVAVDAASGDDGVEGVGAREATEELHAAIRTTKLSSATTGWCVMHRIRCSVPGRATVVEASDVLRGSMLRLTMAHAAIAG